MNKILNKHTHKMIVIHTKLSKINLTPAREVAKLTRDIEMRSALNDLEDAIACVSDFILEHKEEDQRFIL